MGAVFSMLGGLYFWFEKLTGARYAEILGKIHFWSFFVGVNLTFFPMHFLGVAGMPRRIPDYPDAYFIFNKIASWGSYISALSSLFFFYVVYNAFTKGRFIFVFSKKFLCWFNTKWYKQIKNYKYYMIYYGLVTQ